MAETITDAELIKLAIESALIDLHTAMPGKVLSYDSSSQTVTAQPLINRMLPDGTGDFISEKLPALQSVPVIFPRSGGFFVSFPITPGDFVLLVFNERPISSFRQKGDVTDPGDLKTHSLNGAVAYPGFYPNNHKLANASASNMVMGGDIAPTTRIEITSSGINIGAGAIEPILKGTSFVSALGTLIAGISTALAAVNTYAGAVAAIDGRFSSAATILGTAIGSTYPPLVTAYNLAANAAKSTTAKVL